MSHYYYYQQDSNSSSAAAQASGEYEQQPSSSSHHTGTSQLDVAPQAAANVFSHHSGWQPPSYSMPDNEGIPPSYSTSSQSAIEELVKRGWSRSKATKAVELHPNLETAAQYLKHEQHYSWKTKTFKGPDEDCPFCQEIDRQNIAAKQREYEERRQKGQQRSDWRSDKVYSKFEAATEVVAGTIAVPFYLAYRAKEKRAERKKGADEWDSDDY